jgi:hypothetical protein
MNIVTDTSIRQLTSNQYDAARAAAIARVQARIGEKPTRKQFRREYGTIITVLDVIAAVVFLAALAISSAHIIAHMGLIASASYPEQRAGIRIDLNAWAMIHQVAAIFLAEASALLFAALHSMNADQRARRPGLTRYVSVPGVLAVLAGAFVLSANLASGVDLLTALLPPVMTLGIAVRLEAIAVALLKRAAAVDERYSAALAAYEAASADPTAHADFLPMLRQEVFAALCRKNADLADAPRGVKWAAVERELARETEWTAPPSDDGPIAPAAPAAPAAPRRRGGREVGEVPLNGSTAAAAASHAEA